MYTLIELFAGESGLALGVEKVEFDTIELIQQLCSSGNFSMKAVPSAYEVEFQTHDRRQILETIAKQRV